MKGFAHKLLSLAVILIACDSVSFAGASPPVSESKMKEADVIVVQYDKHPSIEPLALLGSAVVPIVELSVVTNEVNVGRCENLYEIPLELGVLPKAPVLDFSQFRDRAGRLYQSQSFDKLTDGVIRNVDYSAIKNSMAHLRL